MADMLCAPEDIASLLESDLDAYKTIMLVEAATAVVQAACDNPPQRLVAVDDAEYELMGSTGLWLNLPQRPVRSITSLTLDGEPLVEDEDYTRFGWRLYRQDGWQPHGPYTPSKIRVVYSHGYEDGAQELQLARSAVLSLVKGVYGNPTGALAVRIDDYSATYARLSAELEASPYLQAALERQYGRRAGLVRLS